MQSFVISEDQDEYKHLKVLTELIESTERLLGSFTSSSEAAILHVTFWNNCCSSIGVSIRFQSSNKVVARSWSCEKKDVIAANSR